MMNLLGFKEEIVKGIHVDIARSRSCGQEACPLPEINIKIRLFTHYKIEKV
jgi:hypothetical protein